MSSSSIKYARGGVAAVEVEAIRDEEESGVKVIIPGRFEPLGGRRTREGRWVLRVLSSKLEGRRLGELVHQEFFV